jgi:hypothetical protein
MLREGGEVSHLQMAFGITSPALLALGRGSQVVISALKRASLGPELTSPLKRDGRVPLRRSNPAVKRLG